MSSESRSGIMLEATAMSAAATLEAANEEDKAKLEAYVADEMKQLKAAKEEYVALWGGENPSWSEVQQFIKFRKGVESTGRSHLDIKGPTMNITMVAPNLTRYPYHEWDMRGACCVCPPCAMCPGYFKCPIQCPLCFPLTIFGCCTTPPFGLPKNNPCCLVTYLCKPLELTLARPCLVVHPCKLPCCNLSCCSCKSSCKIPCGFKTIGCDCYCCHFTFTLCPSCCPQPCCAKEKFQEDLSITRQGVGAPALEEMHR